MKLISINFDRDIEIIPVSEKWYRIPHAFTCSVIMDCGTKIIKIDPDFLFDGRSGSSFIEAFGIAPNLGGQNEVKAFLLHDICYYDNTGISFNEANYILYRMLRDAGYGYCRAKLIQKSVDWFGKSHFGTPKENEREFPNLSKIHVRHYDK